MLKFRLLQTSRQSVDTHHGGGQPLKRAIQASHTNPNFRQLFSGDSLLHLPGNCPQNLSANRSRGPLNTVNQAVNFRSSQVGLKDTKPDIDAPRRVFRHGVMGVGFPYHSTQPAP